MNRMDERTVRVSDDTTYVTINDQTFYLFNKSQMDEMISWSWMRNEREKFEWITDDLYLYADFSHQPYFDDSAICALKTLIRRALEDK